MRALSVALVLLVSAPVWAEPPTQLRTGEPAPFDGSLVDKATASALLEKRRACETDRDQLRAALEAKAMEPAPASGQSCVACLVPAGAWVLLGAVLGGGLVYLVRR